MKKFDIKDLSGVIPALVTPFDEQENLDIARGKILCEFLVGQGVHALYITGSTGEGFLMTAHERMRFTESVLEIVNGRIPVIVHVGDIGTKKSIELARHAEASGATAISSVPPFFYKFREEDVFNYYKDIAESIGIPMIVYNIALAGAMGVKFCKKLATIDNVKGIKYTLKDHDDMACLKQDLGVDFKIFSGCDEMAAQGLLSGADGLIGSFYNLMPDTYLAIWSLCKQGDFQQAFEIQKVATKIIKYIVQWDYFPLIKHLLTKNGIDAGYSRKPFMMADEKILSDMYAFLAQMKAKYPSMPLGAFDWI